MTPRAQTVRIRQFLIDRLPDHPRDIVRVAADRFSLSRQAIQRHLTALVREGAIAATGTTRSRQYLLRPINNVSFTLRLAGLEEHIPWRARILPELAEVPKNVVDILEYGFTEMLNNAIDHSASEEVLVSLLHTSAGITLEIHDAGVGIFRKIMTEFQLPDEVAAICELVKGKLTTDPARHTGEGVFFTSRMCDYFSLLSGTLLFLHTQPEDDWLIEHDQPPVSGTHVKMGLSLRSPRTREEVFNEFADPEKYDYTFSKTCVPVVLSRYGQENLVSRSQAKRLLQRFENFREVVLDFAGVEFIGQGFADEIFRVFRNSHPETEITAINAATSVRRMISHVQPAPNGPESSAVT
jgi:hypothetical protein